jgi:hypothetical protein
MCSFAQMTRGIGGGCFPLLAVALLRRSGGLKTNAADENRLLTVA